MNKNITNCPYCGNDEYYVYFTVSGKSSYNYKLGTNEPGYSNSDIWDGIYMKEQRTMYCNECHKKIGIKDKQ